MKHRVRHSAVRIGSAMVLVLLGTTLGLRAQPPADGRVRDVIYHRKHGVVLTMDVFRPQKPTGVGVLWMVSGGWFSSHAAINAGIAKPFTDRGQTVFAVVHGSRPKYNIPEIVDDVERATRFIRHNARDYGVDPDRLGITGGSAGGHLSLMVGARAKEGQANATDPVDRQSSRVQAVACFFPPTDFLNYGEPNRNALAAEELKPFWDAFAAKSREQADLEAAARFASPVTYFTKAMPPTLIIHGDADKLVPIQQAEVVMKRLEDLQVPHKLVVRKGEAHGWKTLGEDVTILAEWIDEHVKKK